MDLHTHSAVSDGTDSPAGVARTAHSARIAGFALTDHDTTAGWADASAAAQELGLTFIPGIEVSTRFRGRSVHMLAYWINPSENTALAHRLHAVRESRRKRAQKMVERIAADFPITWDSVCELAAARGAGPRSIGRPHIADALIAAGSVGTRDEAFGAILTPDSPYYVPYDAIDSVEAIALIAQAGGVSVGAHLLSGGRGDHGAEASGIRDLLDAGLCGLEVDHREHAEPERTVLRTMAAHAGAVITGGSDYHGSGKPNRIGENLTSPDQLEALYSRASTTQ